MFRRLLSWSRYLVAVAVVSILALVIGMLAYGGLETISIIRATFGAATPVEQGEKHLLLSAIEVVDLFLLSTVLLVIALGLYELFIDDRLDLPPWLEIHDLNDLKEKLIQVIVVVLGVIFLGHAVTWNGGRELLWLGAAIAFVIAALTFFVSRKAKVGGEP
jgi:uncharacterized membrane protein YqhA